MAPGMSGGCRGPCGASSTQAIDLLLHQRKQPMKKSPEMLAIPAYRDHDIGGPVASARKRLHEFRIGQQGGGNSRREYCDMGACALDQIAKVRDMPLCVPKLPGRNREIVRYTSARSARRFECCRENILESGAVPIKSFPSFPARLTKASSGLEMMQGLLAWSFVHFRSSWFARIDTFTAVAQLHAKLSRIADLVAGERH